MIPQSDARRRFLLRSAAAAGGIAIGGCTRPDLLDLFEITAQINYPGMQAGHLLLDHTALPAPSAVITTDLAILGSGVAGLTAAWQLSKHGFHDFLTIDGPEFGGNAAGGQFGSDPQLRYPRGAHYLPLPSIESVHVREMLSDFGVILRDPFSAKPYYDEACIVHAPDERLYFNGSWQEGLVPTQGITPEQAAQHRRFFQYVDQLKSTLGADGRKVFAMPRALSSSDPVWRQLDTITFRQWLQRNGYSAETLLWYLNYACRDDYGAEYDKVSAWSGLHYFASRGGQAANAADGAVLTWPDGLNAIVRHLFGAIGRHQAAATTSAPVPWHRPGFAVRVTETGAGVEVLCAQYTAQGLRSYLVKAKRALCAMPLMVTAHLVPHLASYGFDAALHLPSYAPWLVSNFLMQGFPSEQSGAPLAWDNVLYQGRGLGYVVSTHQDIRVAAPPRTVFSAYQALSGQLPSQVRRWLASATPQQLLEEAASDLRQVYGFRLEQHMKSLDITVRGHAMASPLVGSLSNRGTAALSAAGGKAGGRLLFAHADLSGYSVFEEAAWWGYRAAQAVLG